MPLFKKRNKKEKKEGKNKKNTIIEKEGMLAVDVYQTNEKIIIIAPISSINEDEIDIYAEGNTVTISGKRNLPEEAKEDVEFLHQECFWGPFSREIVLSEEVDTQGAKASFDNGMIKLILPKMRVSQRKKITISGN